MWLLAGSELIRSMSSHVQQQMIGSAKSSCAKFASEWFDASVFTKMSRKFIGTCETPCAGLPCANVRFFTWKQNKKKNVFIFGNVSSDAIVNLKCQIHTGVRSFVSFEMWTFCINFIATDLIASMNLATHFCSIGNGLDVSMNRRYSLRWNGGNRLWQSNRLLLLFLFRWHNWRWMWWLRKSNIGIAGKWCPSIWWNGWILIVITPLHQRFSM